MIKKNNLRCGIAIKPKTSIKVLEKAQNWKILRDSFSLDILLEILFTTQKCLSIYIKNKVWSRF